LVSDKENVAEKKENEAPVAVAVEAKELVLKEP